MYDTLNSSYNIHKYSSVLLLQYTQVLEYSALVSLVLFPCPLMLHITQYYDTITNPPLVLSRRVQITTSQRRFEVTVSLDHYKNQRF